MIELVIALFVLTAGVVGVYNAFSIMVVATAQMSDRFTAAYLAQEGIEIVRNIRDNNWLNNDSWDKDLMDGDCPSGCQADYKTGTSNGLGFTAYGSGAALNIDADGFYSYSSCPISNSDCQTKFIRKIIINTVDDHTLQVVVTVEWFEKKTIFDFSGTNSITAEEYLYNWYQ